MINNVKIIHEGTNTRLFIDDIEIDAIISYQVNASIDDRQSITIVMLANIEIENKEVNKRI